MIIQKHSRFGTHETFLIIMNVENCHISMQTDFLKNLFDELKI